MQVGWLEEVIYRLDMEPVGLVIDGWNTFISSTVSVQRTRGNELKRETREQSNYDMKIKPNRCIYGWMDLWVTVDGWIDGRISGWTYPWMDG